MTRVFVNGTFDVLHPGHIALLRYAVDMGQHLLVAIDSDRRVQELKGPTRPFFDSADRKFILESISGVDEVVVFDSDQELEDIIQHYQPEIMVKGSDYEGKHIIGAEHCGRIEFFKRLDDYSTSKILEHTANR